MSRPTRTRLAVALAAGVAGLLVQHLAHGGLAQVEPGRMVTLPVAILYGPWLGALAGVIGILGAARASQVVVCLLEAVAVGAAARRGYSPVIAGGLCWTLNAVAFGLAPGLFGAEYSSGSIWPLAMQHLLNGMVAVVVAELAATLLAARAARDETRQLRRYAFHAFVLTAVLPVLALSSVTGQLLASRQQAEGRARLTEIAAATRDRIQEYVEAHARVVDTLAASLSTVAADPARRRAMLALYPRINRAFDHVTTVDTDGMLLETTTALPAGAELRTRGVADRAYFQQAVAARRSVVSDAIASRAGDAQATVVIAAPFYREDRSIAGVACGILQLQTIEAMVEQYRTLPEALITVVDHHNRVIHATAASNRYQLQDLGDSPLVQEWTRQGGRTFEYAAGARDGVAEPRLVAVAIVPGLGWRVYVEQPVSGLRLQTTSYYLTTLALVLVALAGAVLSAQRFSRAVTRPLEDLVSVVRSVSVQEQPDQLTVDTRLTEVAQVIEDVNHMQRRLADSYLQLTQALGQKDQLNTELHRLTDELDRKVRERTAELARATRAAEEASRTKSEFLANMSHEIRTPMNGILGMTEITLNTELAPVQREYLETVRQSAESLLVIINDILDFSKIEAGKLEIESVAFSLRGLLDQTLKPLAFRAHEKRLELAVDVRADVPDALVGDPHRLRQVLVNLIGNAIKFTSQGEVVVQVTQEPAEAGRARLVFRVSDTGIGIPRAKQATIFQAFTQADGSTTRQFGGTGLGLTISSQLVSLMGGRLWVESKEQHGSTFGFTLDLAVTAATGPQTPIDVHPGELAGLSALVVDDNTTNLRILSEMLHGWGMEVATAADGRGALALAERTSQAFGVVLVDMYMPESSGLELAAELRHHPRCATAPIVILTSSDRSDEPRRAAAVADLRYLVKPVAQHALLEAIREALGTRESADTRPAAPAVTPMRAAGRLRVLVAEDNVVNRKLAEHLLRRRGHDPVMVTNGREAVDALDREGLFDLVLMDLQMPEMDGFEATASIRARERQGRRRIPIVALTAHAMEGDRQRCLDADMDGYVSKPVNPVELFDVIDRVMAAAPALPRAVA